MEVRCRCLHPPPPSPSLLLRLLHPHLCLHLLQDSIVDIDQYPHITGLHVRDVLLGDSISPLHPLSLSSWCVGKERENRDIIPHNLRL